MGKKIEKLAEKIATYCLFKSIAKKSQSFAEGEFFFKLKFFVVKNFTQLQENI